MWQSDVERRHGTMATCTRLRLRLRLRLPSRLRSITTTITITITITTTTSIEHNYDYDYDYDYECEFDHDYKLRFTSNNQRFDFLGEGVNSEFRHRGTVCRCSSSRRLRAQQVRVRRRVPYVSKLRLRFTTNDQWFDFLGEGVNSEFRHRCTV